MVGIVTLWLPIVVSAICVFLVSSIIHMALPWHKKDYTRMPDEEKEAAYAAFVRDLALAKTVMPEHVAVDAGSSPA